MLVALWALMAGSGGLQRFAALQNQENLARSIGLQGIFAVGELLVILTGGIDLSVGSLIAFGGMLLATVMTRLADAGTPVGVAVAAGVGVTLLFSLALGVAHALLVHCLRLPPFVVTLASMSVLRSGALLLNNAVPVPIERFTFITFLGNQKLYVAGTGLGLPVPMLILLGVAAVLAFVLVGTGIGRQVYALGSNEEAARLSGVRTLRVRIFAYGGCSLLAGVAAVLYTGYASQGDPSSGTMFELNAISAAVIGGALLTGGRGSVLGTVLGTALLESILNIINLRLSNPALWRGIVVGGVLLAAVVFNQFRRLRRA